MPVKTTVNLTSADDTYTAAAGDYEINGVGGNDTVTTGAGNSSVNTGLGNSTITTGAGDSLVHTLDGNQTITTGAGDSSVSTGVGNSTITTGAGVSIVLTGNGNNTITTGAGASHITTGAGLGDDTITTGAGDAVVDSGLGKDTVTTGAGNDLVFYHVTGNQNNHSVFNGGTGIDTLNLVMTRAEWMSDAVQTDVASYLDFLAANKGANGEDGEDGAAAYTFKAFGLTASMFEKLRVTVDGVILEDVTNSTVALHNDAISTTEKVASAALNVLANDAVPDLIQSFSFTNPAHGSVHLDAAYLDTALPPSAQFIYTPNTGFYDYLAVGESASDAFTYTVTDAAGGVSTATVVVTINGTNDAPVITSALLSGAVTEQVIPAGSLTSSGTISFSDLDLSDTHAVSSMAALSGTLGTLSANVTTDDSHTTGLGGVVSWAYSVNNAAVQYLAAGETKVEIFTVSLSDGHGGVVASTVSVTITGTNEAPVITSAAQAGAVKEDVTLIATGTVTSSDVDNGATATYTGNAVGTYGSFAVTAGTGAWTYTLDNAHHQNLAQGESHTETFLVTVTDDKNATATQNVVLTITGTNDAPVITSSAQAGAVQEDVALTASGTVTSSDVDNGATASYTGSATGTYGSFAVTAGTGAWTYTLDNAHHQNLAQGESHTETFTVTVTDDKGAIAMQAVALTITGTNDAPVIGTAALSGAVTEQVTPAGNLTSSGAINFSDVDLSDSHTVSAVVASSGTLGTLTASVSSDDSHTTGLGGVVTWAYSVADSAVESLAIGETKVETFSFNVLDGQGGSVARTITVTITGTNDAPVIGTAVLNGAVTEKVTPAGNLTSSGAINFSDVDLSDVHTVSAVAASSGTLGALTASVSTDTNHTTGLGGVVTWVYSVDNAKVQYLAAGQIKVETFTVSLSDGHGSVVPSTVSVTITGTNNAPIATNDVFNGSITGGVMTFEAGTYSGTYGTISAGGFNFSNGANSGLFVHGDTYGTNGSAALFSNGGPGPNMYMTHADGHAFSLQSANIISLTDSYYSKATEVVTGYLNGVQVAQQAFTVPNYYLQKNNLVTFTASGFNAVDNVLFSAQGSIYQFIDTVNSGVIRPSYDDFNVLANDTDIDNGSTLSIANFSAVSTMGAAITLNANGTLHYDPTLAAGVQALAAGQAGTDTFTYVTKDEHGALSNTATVSVSVIGFNEAPVITSVAQTGSVSEGNGQPASSMTTTGRVTYSDVDLTDTHALSISTLAAHGSASVNAQGNWSYTLTNDATVNALTTGQHLSDSFTVLVDDLHGGKASQVVSIDITNIKDANHAPVANPDSGVSINSNGSVPVSFTTSGTAYQNGAGSSEYVITKALNSQAGALWSDTKVSLDKSFSVSAELYFGDISNGADGFSFIMQNQSKSIIGQAGQGLGYAGISNSVGVAFDTYYNAGTIDIREDHTEINTGGRMNGVGGVHILGNGNVKDGKYHAANIDWDASSQKLRVSFDGVMTDNQQLDLASLIGSKEAYVGFAGSTGGLYNLQKINTLTYHSTDNSVVLDVLANDTDVDPGDKVGLKVVSASSEHGATLSFSGVAGTGITYSPGHLFDNLAFGQKDTDVIHYTIEDSHGAMSSSTDIVTIVGVAHHA